LFRLFGGRFKKREGKFLSISKPHRLGRNRKEREDNSQKEEENKSLYVHATRIQLLSRGRGIIKGNSVKGIFQKLFNTNPKTEAKEGFDL